MFQKGKWTFRPMIFSGVNVLPKNVPSRKRSHDSSYFPYNVHSAHREQFKLGARFKPMKG